MMLKKFSILKNGIGIKGQKGMQSNSRSKRCGNQMCYQINPKAFAIPILTALGQANLILVRIWIVNALGIIK